MKLGCEHLKSCCPVAKLCEQWIAEKTITKALKQKHIEINRKTMECRTSIRQKMSSSGDIITNATTEDTQAVLEAKLEDIITDWADDASGDGGVLNKSNRSVRIRTNKLYPPSYDFTRRSSQRGNFSEILRQRLHGFASFVDEINDIVEKYKQKRKKMSKISKKITVRRRENFTDTDENVNKIDADSSESSTSTASSSSPSSHHKKHSSSLLKNLNIVSMIKKNGKFIPGFTPFLANVDYNFRSNIRLKPPTNTSTKLTVISEIHNPNDTTSNGDMEENSTSEYSFITSSGSDSDSASAFTSTSTSGSNSMKSTNKKHLLKLHKSSKSLVSKDGQKQSVETINLDRDEVSQNRKRNRHGEHAKSQRVNGIILKNSSEPASHINEVSQSFSFVKEETSSADGESSLTNGTSVHVSSVSSKSASKSNASSKSAAKSARSGLEIITNAIRLPVNNLIFNEAKGKHSAATKVDTSSTDDIQRTINDVKQKVLQHAATHKLARIRIEPAKVRRKLLYRGEGTAVVERKRRPVWTSTLLSSKNLRRSSTHHHHHNHRSQISTAADRLSLRKIGGTAEHHTKKKQREHLNQDHHQLQKQGG
ncbi:unnamed protein product [Anisakis simplex]|uniref:Uncharacterized protein n=1 Tax=Anisakis simplex TaxID=6269 RepID=A0A3P6TH05_ANISI|nr:unnamed protein product [Anisakis simplex]